MSIRITIPNVRSLLSANLNVLDKRRREFTCKNENHLSVNFSKKDKQSSEGSRRSIGPSPEHERDLYNSLFPLAVSSRN